MYFYLSLLVKSQKLMSEALANRFNELPKPVLMFCRTGNRSNNLYQIAKQMDLLDDE